MSKLKKQAIAGAKWTTVSTIIKFFSQFVFIAILAHLLTAEEFGIVGMTMIIIGFAQMFADVGMSAAIIHHQEISRKELSSLYWLSFISGIFIYAIILAISPLASDFFKEPILRKIYPIAAISFLITPIGQQYQILLQKELKFSIISKIEIVAALVSKFLGIILAFMDFGIYSLLLSNILNVLILEVLLFIYGSKVFFKPLFHFRILEIKIYISFGLYQMGTQAINYFASKFDQILIGRLLGAEALGFYNLAFNLVLQPFKKINPILNRIMFPVFAKLQNDNEKLKRIFFQSIKYLQLLIFPMLIGLAVVARPLILLIYGEKWLPMVPLVQILSFVSLFIITGNPFGSILLAKGRVDLGFKWEITVSLLRGITITFMIRFGLVGIAIGLLFLNILTFFPYYFFLKRPLIGKCFKENFWFAFFKPLLYSLLMGSVVYTINLYFSEYGNLTFVVSILIGILTYLIILILFEQDLYKKIKYISK